MTFKDIIKDILYSQWYSLLFEDYLWNITNSTWYLMVSLRTSSILQEVSNISEGILQDHLNMYGYLKLFHDVLKDIIDDSWFSAMLKDILKDILNIERPWRISSRIFSIFQKIWRHLEKSLKVSLIFKANARYLSCPKEYQ